MYCAKHNYNFSYVEQEGVRNVHNYLNLNVIAIFRNTAKVDVLKVSKKEKEKLMNLLGSTSNKICLTSNLWSSITSDHYMTLTTHFVDETWEL